jgi:hypothetical protein
MIRKGGITLRYQTHFHPPFYQPVPATCCDALLVTARLGQPNMVYLPRPLRAVAPTPYAYTEPAGDRAAVPMLAWLLLRDTDSMVRMYAAETLGAIGWKAWPAVPALIVATGDRELGAFAIPVSQRATEGLGQIAQDVCRSAVHRLRILSSHNGKPME